MEAVMGFGADRGAVQRDLSGLELFFFFVERSTCSTLFS